MFKIFSRIARQREQKIIAHEIELIEQQRYNNYDGTAYFDLERLNKQMRKILGDVKYLQHLKMLEIENPRPVYKIPDEFFKELE